MRTEKEKMLAGELYDPLDLELVQAMPKMTYSVRLLTKLKRTSRATFIMRGLMYHDTQVRGEHNLLTLHSAQPLLK